MRSVTRLKIWFVAASYLSPVMLAKHVQRRLRARSIPRNALAFRSRLAAAAAVLPPVSLAPAPEALAAAEVAAFFFAAKHTKNVPQCFTGGFTFLNRRHEFGSPEAIDWRVSLDEGNHQLWRANLAFMGYVCTAIDLDPERGLPFAAQVAGSFLNSADFHRRTDFSELWNSYPVSQRILAISAAMIRLPRRLAGGADWHVLDGFLRTNVAFLLDHMETELGFNHLERNLSALALYALAAGEVSPLVRLRLQQSFHTIVVRSIGDDGVQKELCPMYQALTVQSLRILEKLLDVWSSGQRAMLTGRLASAEDALAALTLGDDRPAMFNDGWFGEVPPTSAILPDRTPPGFVALADAGYVRLVDDTATVLFDVGPIGPDANPGHGHADFLSIEMSLGTNRFIVDPGTPTYSAGARRNRTRQWDAHNGPAFEGAEPVEYAGSFKVGRRAAARLRDSGQDATRQWAEGELAFGAFAVARSVSLYPDRGLVLVDYWQRGTGARVSRFLIPDFWRRDVRCSASIIFTYEDRCVTFTVESGSIEIAPGQWSCRYNLIEAASELRCRPIGDTMVIRIEFSRFP